MYACPFETFHDEKKFCTSERERRSGHMHTFCAYVLFVHEAPGFLPLTSVPVHGFQKSTAAALCDLTTEVLRTINATEKAIVEFGLSEPADRQHSVAADVKQADDSFRELEKNVSFIFQCLHLFVCSYTASDWMPQHDEGQEWLQAPHTTIYPIIPIPSHSPFLFLPCYVRKRAE